MSLRLFGTSLLLAAAAAGAGAGRAQTIKPLDVEPDANGVDLLSGQIETPLPVLSIPAAPNLRFQRLQDLLPLLSGRLIPGTPGNESYDVNVGTASSEHFDCTLQSDCRSKKGNGSHLIAIPGSKEFTYYEGGGGREIHFNLQSGPQGPIVPSPAPFEFFASTIRYPSGETLTFAYDVHTDGAGHVWRRPASVTSTVGYTLTLTYQGSSYGQHSWRELASATIHATGSPGTPLARLTYAGSNVTDLGGRSWTCTNCANALSGLSTVTTTALRLPGEAADAMAAEAQPRTYGSVTFGGWVTRVTRDGVDWNYAYAAHPSQPPMRIVQVVTTGPNGYARTVNVENGFNVRPRITSTVDALGRTTSYLYDNDVRVTRVTHPEGNWVGVTYDIVGNITARRTTAKPGSGLADLVETAAFSAYAGCYQLSCFRPLWTRDALGRQTDYSWDAYSGDLLTRLEPADANGQRRKTINSWSGGRLVRERVCLANAAGVELTCGTAAEQVREIGYWGATPLPLSETVTNGVGTQALTTTYSYDAAGRRLSADGPLPGTGDASYHRYDAHGRRTWEIGPLGANGLRPATRTSYRDSDDRALYTETGTVPTHDSTTLTVLTRTDLSYDARRNPVREAVSVSGTTHGLVQRTFEQSSRLECEARRMNPAAFAALPASACTPGTQGAQGPDRITRNLYDAAGQLLQVQRAYGTSHQQNYATYGYSPNGRQTSVTDANGNRASLTWDGHDRQVRWNLPSPTTPGLVSATDYEAYTYDAAGNRLSHRRRDGTTITFQYDALNRVTRRTVPASASGAAGYSVFYGYDLGNRQTFARFGSTSGAGITNAYDIFGRPTASTSNMGSFTRTLSYQYDAGGRRTRLTFPDGNYFTYEHDPAGRLTAIRENGATAVAMFGYDAAGRPSATGFAGAATNYGYDALSRLASLSHNLVGIGADVGWTFAYNQASQIVTRTRSNDAYASNTAYNVNRAYSVNGLNQYTAAGPATFLYDANGNLRADGSTTFVYDAENRLVTATGASAATLSYDPLGRLFQTAGGAPGTTQFLYDGDELVAEYNGAGTLLRRYVHGLGNDDPILWHEGAGLSVRRSLFADHQGSIVAIADAAGTPVALNGYDEWGIPNAANQGRFGYTGQIWIPQLGMWHYKARLYSPTLGRFMQTDPVGYQDQINLYAYVGNDPVNMTDPTGMEGACFYAPGQCGMRPITPEERERTEQAARSVGAAAVTAASFLPIGRAVGWIWRALDIGGRALSQATRTALSGGRHASLIRQFAERSTTSLNRTVSSLTRQIENHLEKIRNPAEHMTRDDARNPQAVQRAINDWSKEIRNYSEQRDIARDILRNRPQCTGTRICP